MKLRTEIDWQQLQTIFAAGSPVLAIGPGCHRIGFDETEEWQRVVERAGQIWHRLGKRQEEDEDEVQARRSFLVRFWVTQLCERSAADGYREEGELVPPPAPAIPPGLDIRDRPEADIPKERARIALATDLLCGLIDTTRLLGATIEAGAEPVTDWQHLAADFDGEGGCQSELSDRASKWLDKAAALAMDLKTIQLGRAAKSRPLRALREHNLEASNAANDNLPLLKPGDIQSGLKELLNNRFKGDGDRVSGAVVDWLSDLFWHVVVSGAGVPPSQGELSFYLNLRDVEYSRQRFSRPHPGEYRGSGNNGEALATDLMTLLEDYDSGYEERSRDWTGKREAFARTIAASLLRTWRSESADRFAIALVSDYDVMLERAMLELLEDDEFFHVITPAALDSRVANDQVPYKWLFGTVRPTTDDGRGGLADLEWEWLYQKEKTTVRQRPGPIVIRLTGSPLFSVKAEEEHQLLDELDADRISHARPTTVYSEHDSVQAIMALAPPRLPEVPGAKGFVEELLFEAGGLTWDSRCWLFFGHRFSDWLPRLQLLFTALMLARGEQALTHQRKKWPQPVAGPHWVAISRRFDWPERALLSSLNIEMQQDDLGFVSTYFDPDLRHDQQTKEYLEKVAELAAVSEPPAEPPGAGDDDDVDEEERVRVFVSYSHEGEDEESPWNTSVRKFANALVDWGGLDVTLDQFNDHLGWDWGQWGPAAVAESDIVICVASPGYQEEWERVASGGGPRGNASEEARTIRTAWRKDRIKILFVVLPGRSAGDIPESMADIHREVVEKIDHDGLERVVRSLTGQPLWKQPTPKPRPKLPPRE